MGHTAELELWSSLSTKYWVTRWDAALISNTGTKLHTISTVNVYYFKESLLYLRIDYKLIVKDTKVRVLNNTSTVLCSV